MNHDQQLIYDYVYSKARITMFEALELIGDEAENNIKDLVKTGVLAKKGNVFILAPKKKNKVDLPKMF